jgi:glycosyltransferase involved in cell wall biosynthesis
MLCWRYYPDPGGGADRVMQQVAEALAARGWPISVVTHPVPGGARREKINGVTVRRVLSLPLPRLRFFSYTLAAFWQQLVQAHPEQVLHVNQFYLHVPLAIWLRRLRGMRVVVGVHGSGVAGDMQRLGRLPLGLGRLVLGAGRKADMVISLTTQMTEELYAAGIARERVIQIPNGVDCTRFQPLSPAQRAQVRAQLGLPLERPIVCFSGRLAPEKALDVLLTAWKSVQAQSPEALLVLAGDGPMRGDLEALAGRLGLGESVRFLGWCEQVLPLYQASDVFVLSSWSEGMSLALLEAMACGLAPVVTTIPGNVDVVVGDEHGSGEANGLLVPSGDEAALARALGRVLTDERLRARLAGAALQTVRTRFSLAATTDQYAQLYQRLAQGRAPAQAG